MACLKRARHTDSSLKLDYTCRMSTSRPQPKSAKEYIATLRRAETVCIICRDKLEEGDEPEQGVVTLCGHTVGECCLELWLSEGPAAGSCPICSKKLFSVQRTWQVRLRQSLLETFTDDHQEMLWAHSIVCTIMAVARHILINYFGCKSSGHVLTYFNTIPEIRVL